MEVPVHAPVALAPATKDEGLVVALLAAKPPDYQIVSQNTGLPGTVRAESVARLGAVAVLGGEAEHGSTLAGRATTGKGVIPCFFNKFDTLIIT